MKIILENIGKRFNREWVFRNIDYEFCEKEKYVILGSNGYGKSTLLQIISGAMSQTEGEVKLEVRSQKSEANSQQGTTLPPSGEVARGLLSYAAPYLELPEEMTWKECVSFHGKFKKFISSLKEEDIISISGLKSSANKEIRNFSSGMKQRAKLSLAVLSATPLLLLDEPATNLDADAVNWFQQLISQFANERLVIVCSNYNKEEYSFCNNQLVLAKN